MGEGRSHVIIQAPAFSLKMPPPAFRTSLIHLSERSESGEGLPAGLSGDEGPCIPDFWPQGVGVSSCRGWAFVG